MRNRIYVQQNTTKFSYATWFMTALLLVMALALPMSAQAQGSYLYVDNQGPVNSITAFSISSAGSLTPLTGSPYATGGSGLTSSCPGLNRITIAQGGSILFVSNAGEQTISAFAINPASGALTPAPGSPFPSGLTLDSCQGISLAATPDGLHLLAASNGQINSFNIGPGGVLAAASSTVNCCSPSAGMKIIANATGQFVALSNLNSVSVYSINPADGSLTLVPGSPFGQTGTGSIAALETTCAGDLLYGSETGLSNTSITDAWSVASTGVLTPLPGSPFLAAGSGAHSAILTPDNELLFQSNQFSDTINPAALLAGGSLGNLASTSGSGFSHALAGMAIDTSGTYLFAADENIGLASFRINPRAALADLMDVPIDRPGDIQDLVTYPTRSCGVADLSLAVTTTPGPIVAGQPLVYTVSITNHGPAVSSAVVADTLDAGTTAGGIIPIVLSAASPGVVRANTVSGTTVNGVVTVTTQYPHELVAGQTVTITSVADPSNLVTVPTVPPSTISVTDPSFTGTYQVVSVTPTSFTYNQTMQLSQFVGPPLPIVAATGAARVSNTVTITTTQPYTLNVGDSVTVVGVADPSFNGSFVVASVISTTSFTYTQPLPALPDATSGGGDVTPPSPVPATDTSNGGTATATPCLIAAGGTGVCGSNTNPATTPIAAAGATRTSGIGTVTTTAPHQLFTGEVVTLAGVINSVTLMPDPTFNGSFTVTSVPSPTTFTFDQNNLVPVPPDTIDGGGTVTSAACSGICGGVISSAITSIASASRANSASGSVVTGVVTITTVQPHQLFVGETARISSVPDPTVTLVNPNPPPAPPTVTFTDPGFNGVAVVTSVPTLNSFTYVQTLALSQFGETNFAPPFPMTAVDTSVGGTARSPQTAYATIPVLQVGETQSFSFTATTSGLTTTGTTISNIALISNKSTIDPNLGDNTISSVVSITVGASPTTLTVSPATAGYGGLAILTARLARVSNGSQVSGETISFSVLGNVMGTAVTDNAGQAILTISTAPSAAFPTGIALGSYPGAVTASFAGNTSFGPSTGTGDLTVTPGILTVVPTAASRPYGSANPTLTYGITGFQNGDTTAVVSGTATCSTTATVTSPVGNYPITCVISGLTAANYTFTTINGTLAVSQAPLTITANDASRDFGLANPAFTGTITGLLNGDVITATYDSPATPTSAVGTYPIIPTPVGAASVLANYAITLVNGTLTINPVVVSNAPLTVTISNASRSYGDPNPTFTATISGALNGDVFTATLSTSATAASPVGAYPITATVSGPTANYVVMVVNGTLAVNPAPLSVFVNSATRVYGAADPAFTGTIGPTKNGDVITATYSTATTVISDVGSYPITPTLAGAALGNYAVTITNGFFSITPAPLAITAVGGTRLYGAANPAATTTGLLNGDPITTTYTFPTPATAVGVYTLTPTIVDPAGKIGDYAVTIKTATLTINRAPLTVTASPTSRPFGSANPVLIAVFGAGQVQNGDPITPVASTAASNTSNAGTYPITATVNDPTNVIGNYAVTTVNSTLTVTTVPLSITADPKSMVLNTATPTFTATYAGFVLGQTSANLGGTLKCSATTTGGLHPITCSGQTSPNYAITFVPGVLTVNYSAACKNGPGLTALAPLAPNPPVPTFSKATTSSIPVSFRGCDSKGTSISSAILAPTIAGGPGSVTLIDPNGANVAAAAPTFGFSFANTAWTFGFTTAGRATGSYSGTITLNDGSVIPFSFNLTN